MHWLSFFVGVLVGWLVEWLIDLFYWRRRRARVEADLRARLVASKDALAQTRSELNVVQAAHQVDVDRMQQQIAAAQAEIDRLTGWLRQAEQEHAATRERLLVDLATAQTEAASLREQLDLARSDCQAQMDELNLRLANAEAEAASLRERLLTAQAELQARSDEWALRLSEAQAETAGLRERLAWTEADFQGRIGALEAELAVVNAQAAELCGRLVAAAAVEGVEARLSAPAGTVEADLRSAEPVEADLGERLEAFGAKVAGALKGLFERPEAEVTAELPAVEARMEALEAEAAAELPTAEVAAELPEVEVATEAPAVEVRAEGPDVDLGERLEALVARFAAGVEELFGEGEDDLTRIEGIGPKISALLQAAGIRTFAQLAHTDVSRLQEILDAAGPRFRLADPGTWPEQARLAAEGAWEALQALQDQLKGGRTVS